MHESLVPPESMEDYSEEEILECYRRVRDEIRKFVEEL
jgi:hypothetical protein